MTFLTFIVATLGAFIFVEMTHINPFSLLFSNSEKPTPTPKTESTTLSTTTVKPTEWDPCVNDFALSKFYVDNTQYFVKTKLTGVDTFFSGCGLENG